MGVPQVIVNPAFESEVAVEFDEQL